MEGLVQYYGNSIANALELLSLAYIYMYIYTYINIYIEI